MIWNVKHKKDETNFEKWYKGINNIDYSNGLSGSEEWVYKRYIMAYYDIKISKSQKFEDFKSHYGFHNEFHRKLHKKIMDLDIIEYDKYKEVFSEADKEAKEKKMKLININKNPLSPADRYLVLMANLDHKWKGGSLLLTSSELRNRIKQMRGRQHYDTAKSVDLKIRQFSGNIVDFHNFNFTNSELKFLCYPTSDVMQFASAENNIIGLTDEEIIRLMEVESI